MICTAEPTPPPKFSLGSQEDFFFGRGPFGACKIMAEPKSKEQISSISGFPFNAFLCPQAIIKLRALQRSTFTQLRVWVAAFGGLFSLDTSGLIAFLARFPPGNAHLRLALRRLVRQPRGVAPRRPGAQGTQGPLKPRRWDCGEETPGRRKQPASAEHRAPAWTRLRTSSRGGQGDAAARAARRTLQAGWPVTQQRSMAETSGGGLEARAPLLTQLTRH